MDARSLAVALRTGLNRRSTSILALLVAACSSGESRGGGDVPPDAGIADAPAADAPPADAPTTDAPPADAAMGCAFTGVPFSWPVETEEIPITPSDYWKNRIDGTWDPFMASTGTGESVRWVKFTVLARDPTKVYFQDSGALPLHYDFVSGYLDPYLGMTPAEIDAVSLVGSCQDLILGAVLFPPGPQRNEIGVQLVRNDPYHPEMIDTVIDLVAGSIDAPAGTRVFYMPTYEQHESAEACADELSDLGVDLGSVHRWLTGGQCYSSGWALGRLVQVPGAEIDAAYTSGELEPHDILLTDAVPAEIPPVAGVIALEPATPSSHVAILARSYQVPFGYVADEEEAARILDLVGNWVALEVLEDYAGCWIRVVDIDGKIPPADRDALLEVKDPPPLDIDPIGDCPDFSVTTDDLGPDDIGCYGGKAAHFGLLRDSIPDNSPEAIAISFRLWNDFMDQTIGGGGTLEAEIASRLAGLAYPQDVGAIKTALLGVRDLIKTGTSFDSSLRDQVIAALAPFDPDRRIRFRSSTNVEDSDQFVGAGLYNSISGCLADDLDDDEHGPSRCNSEKPEERGVFRAIRKVFASFYNDNAYLERLRHGVPEDQVGMALLVHHSFPDEIEMANGVATVDAFPTRAMVELVSQPGATSVANPSAGVIPEVVSVGVYSFGTYPTFDQASSLLLLGETVLDWDAEYIALTDLLMLATDRYREVRPGADEYLLDLEYKKVFPGDLVVKQIRPLPLPDDSATHTTYLVDEPLTLCVLQGEASDVFAIHRLKSLWTTTTDNRLLDAAGTSSSLYTNIDLTFLDDDMTVDWTGAPSTWPGAGFALAGDRTQDVFVHGTGPDQRTFTLETALTTQVPVTRSPVKTIRDFPASVTVDYATPVLTVDWTGITTTSTEYAPLIVCPHLAPSWVKGRLIEESYASGGVSVETAYYWPVEPGGIVAGYTAPLYEWVQTTITGLISTPLVLTDPFAQTYRPEHHNFASNFIFDPWLEPNVDAAQRAELTAADVRWIYIDRNGVMWKMTLGGELVTIE